MALQCACNAHSGISSKRIRTTSVLDEVQYPLAFACAMPVQLQIQGGSDTKSGSVPTRYEIGAYLCALNAHSRADWLTISM